MLDRRLGSDPTSGFNLLTRTALERAGAASTTGTGYGFLFELKLRVLRAGLTLEEIPVVFTERRVGRSKMSLVIALEAGSLAWRLRRNGAD